MMLDEVVAEGLNARQDNGLAQQAGLQTVGLKSGEQCGVWSVQFAVCSLQFAVCSVQRAMCSVQCAL